MKNLYRALVCAAMVGASVPALAVNNGFEAGDTSGYTVSGNATAAMSVSAGNNTLNAVEGSYLGYVASGAQNVYQTLTQTFTLGAGGTLSGQVAFLTGDYVPFNDDGYLSVNGVNLFARDVATVGDFGSTGFQAFSFTAPTTGRYTLQIGVANRVDGGVTSITALDAVSVAGVPEPASWALMFGGFGFAGVAMRRRRDATSAVYA